MTTREPFDDTQLGPGFGKGTVPWYLLVCYFVFLVLFTWYTLQHRFEEVVGKPTVEASGGGR